MKTKIAIATTALMMSALTQAATPNFNGVWQVTQPISELKTAEGGTPPLLPAAKKTYEERLAKFKAGKAKDYDASLRACKPLGAARNLYDSSMPNNIQPFEIQQGDNRVMFGYTFNRLLRFVDIKNEFGEIAGPNYYGTSIAKWDGDTLVITGKMFNDATLLDAAGMPHSDELQTIERLRLKDANTLENRITFKDSKIFSKDWQTVVTFKKLPAGTKIQEDLCLQRLNITLSSPIAEDKPK